MANVLESMKVEAEEARTVVKVCGKFRTWRVIQTEGEGIDDTFYITANPVPARVQVEETYRSLYDAVGALKRAEASDNGEHNV